MSRNFKIRWVDFAILAYIFTIALSIYVNNRDAFVTFVGSNVLIILGGYLAGRLFIRNAVQFASFIKLFGWILLATLPFAIYESQTSVMVIPRLLESIPLISSSADVNYPQRNGLYRVQVLFTHPIHYGLFASMCFSLVMIGLHDQIDRTKRLLWSACIFLCCFTSVSSGPFLSMIFQVVLIFYGWATGSLKKKWIILFSSFVLIYIILDALSNRPAYFALIERIAFNSHTALVRRILLEYGLAQIATTPWIGVGYNSWNLPEFMSGSVDNYWLLTAVVYGLPSFVFLFSAFLYVLIASARKDFSTSARLNNLRYGYLLVLFSLMLTLATVAVWSEIATLIFLFLGSGVWFLDQKPDAENRELEEKTSMNRRPMLYTRFAQSQIGQSQGTKFARGPYSGIRVHRQDSFSRSS